METKNMITITIDAGTDILSGDGNHNNNEPTKKSISGSPGVDDSRVAVRPGASLINLRIGAAIDEAAAMHNGLYRKRGNVVTVVQRSRSPIRSLMPPLPYPPKFKINEAWKKVPPIPKLTVVTGPATLQLKWDDGIGMGSYNQYAAVAGHELFACVIEDDAAAHDNVKWEKLTFIKAQPPSTSRRRPIICDMTDMATGAEYYFAVRPVDVHNRRGPCAVAYARL